jgi:hypothetical protein
MNEVAGFENPRVGYERLVAIFRNWSPDREPAVI